MRCGCGDYDPLCAAHGRKSAFGRYEHRGIAPCDADAELSLAHLDRDLQRQRSVRGDSRQEFTALTGRAIETSPSMWSYALSLAIDSGALAAVPADGSLALEIEVEVSEGKLGIGIAGSDPSVFVSPERTLSAMSGAQRVVVAAPASQSKSLAFRNVASEGTRTVFTLSGVRAKAKPSAP